MYMYTCIYIYTYSKQKSFTLHPLAPHCITLHCCVYNGRPNVGDCCWMGSLLHVGRLRFCNAFNVYTYGVSWTEKMMWFTFFARFPIVHFLLRLIYIHSISVLLYFCTSVCMHACMHACMYVCMHVCVCACVHVCMYACLHVCMSACLHVRMSACLHVCMSACLHECMYVCTSVCLYVCMWVCACVWMDGWMDTRTPIYT